jgi:hypothetical protein
MTQQGKLHGVAEAASITPALTDEGLIGSGQGEPPRQAVRIGWDSE